MSTEPVSPNGNGGPTSWRDVYSLVQDVEKRLTDRIDNGIRAAQLVDADHESRIRSFESTAAPAALAASAIAAAVALRVTALEAASEAGVNRNAGRKDVFTYGNKIVAVIVILANVTVGLIAVFRP